MEKKYSEEKIVQILNKMVAGAEVMDTCRKYSTSDCTYYNCLQVGQHELQWRERAEGA